MPHKKKKPQTTSNEKETPKPWPNLPKQLLISLAVQTHLLKKHNLNRLRDQVMEIVGSDRDPRQTPRRTSRAADPHPRRTVPRRGPLHIGRRSYRDCLEKSNVKGSSHGQVVTLHQTSMYCSLREPPSHCTRFLPDWDPRFDLKHAALSSRHDGGFDVMVVTGDCDPAFAICRRNLGGGRAWIMEDCELKEPYAPCQNMRFCNVVELGGRFYASSLQGSVVVVEKVGSRFEITRVGRNRAVPSKGSRQFREYMVESRGEIFVVLLVSRKSIDVVVDVEVFRLDTERLLWVEVGNIGDRALFLEDECCMWVEASELGFKRNCVYFTHHRVSEWFVFDIKLGSILPAFGM